ncbi:lysozyme inhibitor LprI family protein [Labrys monachus]|uniref:Lysozyme inhibitor LprI-like N-terminal domain-containing protein n=1 Tax=Labrys monachus TaxID=217067 RepID=A0ABU0FCE4_9HYPH|nr:lysozyme inhibitor LprI family protein [Labrys monachus]MDQ0391997.1 uncharacterized protein [Labrys monachus]
MKTWLVLAIAAAASAFPFAACAADYAPIDCAKASSPAELAICRTYSLGQAEARMATLFGITTSLVAMGQRGDIGDAQKRWLKTRDACGGDVSCLAEAYRRRIAELGAVMDAIASRGPF